jgi:hypothetical protein
MTTLTGIPLDRSLCGSGSQWPEILGHVTPDDIAAFRKFPSEPVLSDNTTASVRAKAYETILHRVAALVKV